MIKKIKILSIFIVFNYSSNISFASVDSTKANYLLNKAISYLYSDPDSCLFFTLEAKEFIDTTEASKELSIYFKLRGAVSRVQGSLQESLDYMYKSLYALKGSNDLLLISRTFNNIGLVHCDLGEYDKALEKLFMAYEISLYLGEADVGITLMNIGLIYSYEDRIDLARNYYFKALEACFKSGRNRTVPMIYNNLGQTYLTEHPTDTTEYYLKKAIRYGKHYNEVYSLGLSYMNMGVYCWRTGNKISAYPYIDSSLNIFNEISDQTGLASCYHRLGDWAYSEKRYGDAEKYLLKGYEIARENKSRHTLSLITETLTQVNFLKGDYKSAYEYKMLFHAYNDSLYSEESLQKIHEAKSQFELKRKEAELYASRMEKKAAEAELNKKKSVIIFVFAGIFLLMVVLLLLIRQFRIKNKNHLEIVKKNEIIQQKNREILDSIQYARRIQSALLASGSVLQNGLKEHFVFYKPKDIVSGDFYWAAANDKHFWLAVCDCTGHGVPGAFMSLLNISLLNESILQAGINSPDEVLNQVRTKLVHSLNTGQEQNNSFQNVRDGMDGVLVRLDSNAKKIQFSCANNPLFIIKPDGELLEFIPDKMPVGYYSGTEEQFSLKEYNFNPGDTIYIFTDGYYDQFGGNNKKYKKARFKALLKSIFHLSLDEQKIRIENEFDSWKGDFEQNDDILVMGLRM